MQVKSVVLFCFLGVSSLLPWNALISSTEYYDEKFKGTFLEKTYESIFLMVNNFTNLSLNFIFVLYPDLLSDLAMIIWGYISTIASFVMLIVLASVVLISVEVFFEVTVILIFFNALFSGLILIGLSRIMSKHIDSETAITSANIGQALAGIIVSFTNYIIQDIQPEDIAYFQFSVSIFVLLSSFLLFWTFRNDLMHSLNTSIDLQRPLLPPSDTKETVKNIEIIASCWKLLISLVAHFLVTISVYPSLTNLLPPPVVAAAFLAFNLSDFLGRMVTFVYFMKSPDYILGWSLLRLVLILVFLNLVYGPARSYSTVWIISTGIHSILGFSNGFLCSNALIVIAQLFTREAELDVAATCATLCIGIGLTLGSAVSMVFVEDDIK